MQAIRTTDPLEKILKICEAVFILEPSERETIFTSEELEQLRQIYVVAESIYNKITYEDPPRVSVTIPIDYDEAEKYLGFLGEVPASARFISVLVGNRSFLKELDEEVRKVRGKHGVLAGYMLYFFHALSYDSYNALKGYFVRYALPKALAALRIIADVVQPSTLERVLNIFGGVKSGYSVDKRK